MRFILEIAYNGGEFSGFQVQPNAVTVEGHLRDALALLLKQPVDTVGAGRTDAGVHASQMFVHFDYAADELPPLAQRKLNGILPRGIAVKQIYQAARPDFHARFDALSRSYEYHFHVGKEGIFHDFCHSLIQWPDLDAMQEAAELLKHYSDFKCFAKLGGNNKTWICRIDEARFEVNGNRIIFHITADRFLRGMVRAVAGTLHFIGRGKMTVDELKDVIEGRDRGAAGPSVPAKGLFLTSVRYPEDEMIPVFDREELTENQDHE